MRKKTLIPLRLLDADIRRVTTRARQLGMTRQDFLERAVLDALNRGITRAPKMPEWKEVYEVVVDDKAAEVLRALQKVPHHGPPRER